MFFPGFSTYCINFGSFCLAESKSGGYGPKTLIKLFNKVSAHGTKDLLLCLENEIDWNSEKLLIRTESSERYTKVNCLLSYKTMCLLFCVNKLDIP